jgi:hypothetical protein
MGHRLPNYDASAMCATASTSEVSAIRDLSQINQHNPTAHHDALEFPDGQIVLLTLLEEGQQATVLQLPVMQEGARASEPEKARVS